MTSIVFNAPANTAGSNYDFYTDNSLDASHPGQNGIFYLARRYANAINNVLA